MYDTPAPGSIVYATIDYFAVDTRRLSKGAAYVVDRWDTGSGLWIKSCDAGFNCCWGRDWYRRFTTEAPAQPFTLLDDAGRAALRAGDRVLVEVGIVNAKPDAQGDIEVLQNFGVSGPHSVWAKSSDVYALLTPAPKPIAIGDAVRIVGGSTGKVLAQASDGRWAVEYDAGGTTEVRSYDASCLEVVS